MIDAPTPRTERLDAVRRCYDICRKLILPKVTDQRQSGWNMALEDAANAIAAEFPDALKRCQRTKE